MSASGIEESLMEQLMLYAMDRQLSQLRKLATMFSSGPSLYQQLMLKKRFQTKYDEIKAQSVNKIKEVIVARHVLDYYLKLGIEEYGKRDVDTFKGISVLPEIQMAIGVLAEEREKNMPSV